tara:strand:+ start:4913 stop:6556 length:1644 start_codon:yes stop_codon:yes gene_type:complete
MAEKKQSKPVTIGAQGYASYLTQKVNQPRLTGEDLFGGAIDYLNARMVLAETTTAEFLKNMPEDFSTEIVPVETRGQLTTWMQGQKDQLTGLSRELGKMSHKRNSEEYIQLEKEYNSIKSSFEIVQNDLKSLQAFNDLNVDAIKKMASGQKLDDILAAKDFIGKEGYKHLLFENSGVYYNHPTLGKTKVTDLAGLPTRDKKLHLDFYKLGDFAQAAASEGIDLGYDENGAPLNSQTAQLQATLNIFFENETFARDLIFGGLEGYDNTKYIDTHMAEKHSDLVPGTPEYIAKLEEYREEPPIKDAQKFYFNILGDDINQQELDRLKNKKSGGGEFKITQDYRNAFKTKNDLITLIGGKASVKLNNRFHVFDPKTGLVTITDVDGGNEHTKPLKDIITENSLAYGELQNEVNNAFNSFVESAPKPKEPGKGGDLQPPKYFGTLGFSDSSSAFGRFFTGSELEAYEYLEDTDEKLGPSYLVQIDDPAYGGNITVPIPVLEYFKEQNKDLSDEEVLIRAAKVVSRVDGYIEDITVEKLLEAVKEEIKSARA